MILPPSVDASCRSSHIYSKYSARCRKSDKAIANRRYRRKLNGITRDLAKGSREWDEESFDDVRPILTAWEID